MPRDLADVLHYFLPELEEGEGIAEADAPAPEAPEAPALPPTESTDRGPTPPPLPVLGLPIGERDVVRAALAWNLAVETARLGASTTLLVPDGDRGSPLWPEPGVGPLGCELLFCPAKDLRGLYETAAELASRQARQARHGGIVFVRIPPDWLEEQGTGGESMRWMLLLSGARPRDLDDTAGLARALYARHPALELGVTLHGVESIAEARAAFDVLARRTEAESGRPLISYGLLVDDLHVYRAIAAQRPIGLAHPQSPAARALMDVARLLYEDARSRVLG
ncbi:MAG: hypothetical protein NXI30_25375 [bacterium]|nr:hypothetical protein [bacterium]